MNSEARKTLRKYWGFDVFRPMQEEIINSVLNSRDTLALLPTGGGKSICFQLPALMQDGVCLVITPLIALMKDQVNNLKKIGVKAGAIHTGMFLSEMESVYSNCLAGKYKFLYVSPERLENPAFLSVITRLKVNLLTIDEAHCISQWGYDFRPPYLRISDIRPLIPKVPVLALTATATPKVVSDIMEKLCFKSPNLLKSSFERKNLSYSVIKESDKTGKMIHLLSTQKGSAIVYVRNRKKTRELSEIFSNNKISATYYHAGLDAKTREERQKQWSAGKIRVIVATNAFGMGIDKADVRQVFHIDLPDCIESYFQEAGRAGRDQKHATAYLLINNLDLANAKKKLLDSFPPLDRIRLIYNAICNYFQIPEGSGKDMGFDFVITDFTRHYGLGVLEVYNSIKFLEREGYLYFIESSGQYSKIFISLRKEDLYRFLVENPGSDRLVKEVLRSYAGIFTDYININETQLAKRADMQRDEVVNKLIYLNKIKIINYHPVKTKPQIVFAVERLNSKNILFSKENYANLKIAAEDRLQHLLDFTSNSIQCRNQQLLHYFGEIKPNRCGICDVCQKKNKTDLNEIEFSGIKNMIKQKLKEKPTHLYELISSINKYEEEDIISVLQWLLDSKKVIRQKKDETLSWYEQLDLEF